MEKFKVGDKVRIKARPDWPLASGYKLTGQTGKIFQIMTEPEGSEGYCYVSLDKDATGIDARLPIGFRLTSLEKISKSK
jgi:hypothetical protein